MRQIKQGVFETNSSSVHTISICSKKEFEDWEKGELLADSYNNYQLIPKEEVRELNIKSAEVMYNHSKEKYWKDWEDLTDEEKDELIEKYNDYHRFLTRSEYLMDDESITTYLQNYTTVSGDEIVIYGKYGVDY